MIKLKTPAGISFYDMAKKAKAATIDDIVSYTFNNVKCIVDQTTNIKYLWRDYDNAHIMKWKTIGPDCEKQYLGEIKVEIDIARKEEQKCEELRGRINAKIMFMHSFSLLKILDALK